MKRNESFGILDRAGAMVFAPASFQTVEAVVCRPSARDYADAGFLPVMDDKGAAALAALPEGTDASLYIARPTGWEYVTERQERETGGTVRTVTVRTGIRRLYEAVPKPAPVKVYSRLFLKMALADAGILAAVESALSQIEVRPGYTAWAAFEDANEIRTDFQGFDEYKARLVAELGVTDAQAAAILAAAEVRADGDDDGREA